MIKTGIISGAGYVAGELLRLLAAHPDVEIKFIQSNSQTGKNIDEVHTDLFELDYLKFQSSITWDVDVVFLCAGHGKSEKILSAAPQSGLPKIIDLSSDFRLKRENGEWVYGLTELFAESIAKADKIANPGCFATAIQLGLIPLVSTGKIKEEVHVNAITGSTGAGVSHSDTSHFSWRYSNLSVYKPFQHQHLAEINCTFSELSDKAPVINFIPVRGNFSRGIFASIYTQFEGSEKEAVALYEDFYKSANFVKITGINPDLKQVVNTNNALIHIGVQENKILIISLLDNLLKGAAGQAVQNMNLMFGLEEKTGLKLKSIAF